LKLILLPVNCNAMNKIVVCFFILFSAFGLAQAPTAFKAGEWLKFRVHFGPFNAVYATMHLKSATIDSIPVYHAVGEGHTKGLIRAFYKVDDIYQSYFGRYDGKPYRFLRNINEGGYTKDLEIDFDYDKETALLTDNKNKKKFDIPIHQKIQDVISASYALRNQYSKDDFEVGESIDMDMLFDDDGIYKFKLKYLGTEVLRTKFGKVECLKFRPYVPKGRIFEEEESVTVWVSNDLNKIPVRIKAELVVGSIKADLDAYNGLKNQFKIIMN